MKAAINSLNGGEITPLMRGRGDLESLRRAAVQMANFMPRVFGGAGRRPSLMHVAESLDGDKHSRLILHVLGDDSLLHRAWTRIHAVLGRWNGGA